MLYKNLKSIKKKIVKKCIIIVIIHIEIINKYNILIIKVYICLYIDLSWILI